MKVRKLRSSSLVAHTDPVPQSFNAPFLSPEDMFVFADGKSVLVPASDRQERCPHLAEKVRTESREIAIPGARYGAHSHHSDSSRSYRCHDVFVLRQADFSIRVAPLTGAVAA